MSQRTDNAIVYERDAIVSVLRDLELLVVSLDRLGSAMGSGDVAQKSEVLMKFFVDWKVLPRLARIRAMLCEPFSPELGSDGKEELERILENTPHWSLDSPDPPTDRF